MKSLTAQQAWGVLARADRLYAPGEVEAALERMAAAITRDLRGREPLVVCILNGGVVPFGKLLPQLQLPLDTDYIHATRYRGATRGGELHWLAGPAVPARGRTVLLVDDILDEGATLAAIEQRYRESGADAVYKAVLVVKQRSRVTPISVEYAGVEVPDRYVFGYGMDYKGYLRNAPGVYAVHVDEEHA